MRGNEQDVVERQRLPGGTHLIFSYAQKRIIHASTAPENRVPRDTKCDKVGAARDPRVRAVFDVRPPLDYFANVINAAGSSMSMVATPPLRRERYPRAGVAPGLRRRRLHQSAPSCSRQAPGHRRAVQVD
jgi:hypothetical protein